MAGLSAAHVAYLDAVEGAVHQAFFEYYDKGPLKGALPVSMQSMVVLRAITAAATSAVRTELTKRMKEQS